MQTGAKQLLLVAGALVISAALYFAPHKTEKMQGDKQEAGLFTFEGLLEQAKKGLKRQELDPIQAAESALAKDTGNTMLLDTLGKLWDRIQLPVIAAHYFEKIAEQKNTEKDWLNAAYRFYDAFHMTGDSLLRVQLVNQAVRSYKKVLEINPSNLDAKTDLGLCYTEGTGSPMQGIMMLREVVEADPNHENAQYNLGILSVRSGQLDKAVGRFEKVLEINPGRIEARYLLARTYLQMGDKLKARTNFEIVLQQTSDPQLKQEVNSLISQTN